MLYTVEAKGDLEAVCTALQAAVTRHQFGVLHVHDLNETLARKGAEFGPRCRIFEVCNPQQAKRVLEQNLAISTALPCRISIYAQDDRVTLATIRPGMMVEMFGEPNLAPVAQEVEAAIIAIMDEAAGKERAA